MDTGILLIGAIMLLLVLLPFVYMRWTVRRRRNKMINQMKSLAASRGLQLGETGCLGHFAISISRDGRELYTCRHTSEGLNTSHLRLDEFSRCHLLQTTRDVSQGKDRYQIPEKLHLVFESGQAREGDSTIEIYHADRNGPTLNDEVPFAGKWSRLINDALKLRSVAR